MSVFTKTHKQNHSFMGQQSLAFLFLKIDFACLHGCSVKCVFHLCVTLNFSSESQASLGEVSHTALAEVLCPPNDFWGNSRVYKLNILTASTDAANTNGKNKAGTNPFLIAFLMQS